MSSVQPSSSVQQAINSPCFPPEVFLAVFSFADRTTLASLCLVNTAFFRLTAPLLYDTIHFDEVSFIAEDPDFLSVRSSRLSLNDFPPPFSLVKTLHLTLLDESNSIPFPQTDMPKLQHLHIHLPYDQNFDYLALFPSMIDYSELLPHLNPVSITFHLTWTANRRGWNEYEWIELRYESEWADWVSSRTKLEELVIRGGSLYHAVPSKSLLYRSDGNQVGSGSVRLVYDVRAIGSDLIGVKELDWVPSMLQESVFSLPLARILVRTSSSKMLEWVGDALVALGQDQSGRSYRERVEITLEEGLAGKEEQAEMDAWREKGGVFASESEESEAEGSGFVGGPEHC